VDSSDKQIDNAEVSLKLKKHEFKFGCNAFLYEEFDKPEQNAAYAEKFKDLFNMAVVPFYWSDMEPEDGKLRFSKDSVPIYRRPTPDLLLEFCKKNDITPKGHPLFWWLFYPEWLSLDLNTLTDRIERHFKEIAERYGDSIKTWDVINEVLTWQPLVRNLPKNQIELTFKLAEKYFSAGTTLIYNEGTRTGWGEYSGDYTPFKRSVQQFLAQGLKIDCLGLQYHMFYKDPEKMLEDNVQNRYFDPKYLFAVMDQYGKLDIPFNVSEISISGADIFGGDALQAKIIEKLYRIWFSHPNNSQIIWWNLVDGTAAYAPIGSNEGENFWKAGLLNYDFSHKPAYDVMKNLIHNEWTTNTTLNYHSEGINKFHGFYGDYEATIKTSKGEFKKSFTIYKEAINKIKLKLD